MSRAKEGILSAKGLIRKLQIQRMREYSFTSLLALKGTWLLILMLGIMPFGWVNHSLQAMSGGDPTFTPKDSIKQLLKYHKPLLHFEANKGEWRSSDQYRLNMPGAQVRFADDAVDFTVYRLERNDEAGLGPTLTADQERENRKNQLQNQYLESQGPDGGYMAYGHNYQMRWQGSNPESAWQESGQHGTVYSRFKSGAEVRMEQAAEELWKEELYEGIDVRFYAQADGQLEYDYILHPGARWQDIRFYFEGVGTPYVNQKGEIELTTSQGSVQVGKPYAYQVIDGVEKEVPCEYGLHMEGHVVFLIDEGSVDSDHVLVIDPVAVKWSSYYGGSQSDVIADIVEDTDGVFALFSTLSLDFPVSPGAFQISLAGNQDLAVVRLNNSGERVWTTYLGGSQFESANSLKVDGDNVYVVAESSSDDYPITPDAFQRDRSGFSNLVLTALNKDMGDLRWSTYLGGSAFEFGANMVLDEERIYIIGYTGSGDFPVSSEAFQTEPLSGSDNAFISTFDKNGQLVWSTYYSASGVSRGAILIHDALIDQRKLVLTGAAPGGIPLSSNALFTQNGGEVGGYIAVFDAESGVNQYSSFIQNAGNYGIYQVAADEEHYYLYGNSDGQFVHGADAFQPAFGGGQEDLLLVALDKEFYTIIWSTYLGGSSRESVQYSSFGRRTLELDEGVLYTGGRTNSRNFPISEGAFQDSGNIPIGQKFVLASLEASTGSRIWSTYLSTTLSNAEDDVLFITAEDGQLYTAGRTFSDGHSVAPNAFQSARFGNFDLILQEMNVATGEPVCGSYLGGRGNETLIHISSRDGEILVGGNVTSLDFPATVGAAGQVAPSMQESGFLTRLSVCCLPVEGNEIGPLFQEACRQGTPYVIEGADVLFSQGFPDLIRAGVLFSQEETARPGQYRWEESLDSIEWFQLDGAFDRNYQPTPSVETRYYRRIIGCDTSNVATVMINERIAPQLDPGGPFITCPDTPIELGGNPTVQNPNGTYNLQWIPDDVLDDATADNPLADIDRTRIFEAELIDEEGCRVVKNTTAYLIEPYIGGDLNICQGDTLRIGNSPLPVNEEIIYNWSVITGDPNAIVGSDGPPRILVAPNETTTFQLEIQLGTQCVFTDEVLVTVSEAPIANAGDDLVICLGTPVNIGPSGIPDPDVSYRWYPSLGLNASDIAGPLFDGRPRTECSREVYILEVRDAAGVCKSSLDTMTIDILTADPGKDGCGPRRIGAPDRSCGRDQYFWEVLEGDFSSIVGQENDVQPFVDPNMPTLYKLTVSYLGQSCTDEVFVPGCKCPQVDIERFVPINCETLVQELPFCVQLPEAPGFSISLVDGDGFVELVGDELCLLSAIDEPRTYQLQFDQGFVSCISTITFLPDFPEIPPLYDDTLFICPSVQPPGGILIGMDSRDGYEYIWRPQTGLSSPTSSATLLDWTVLVQRRNVYTLEIKHLSSGCVFVRQVTVFLQTPEANAGQDRDFCGGVFAVLGTPGDSRYQYQWSPEDGLNNSQIAQPELNLFDGPGDYVYTLLVTDPNTGCSDTDEVMLRVLDGIEADAGENLNICEGETIQIGDPNAPVIGYTYSWSPVEGLSNPNIPAPLASPGSTTTYSLIVRLDGSNPCEAIASVTLTVNPADEIMGDAGPDLIACDPGVFFIGPEPQPDLIYSWSPVTGLSDPNVAQPEVTVDSSITYILTTIDRESCQIGVDTMEVILERLDELAGPDKKICAGDSVILGIAPEMGVSYSWTPLMDILNSNSANPTVFPNANRFYFVQYEKNGCEYLDFTFVEVSPAPIADAGPDRELCDTPVILGPETPVDSLTYVWNPAEGLDNATIANPSAFPNQSTTYILTVNNEEGCTALDTVQVEVRTPVKIQQTSYNTCRGIPVQIGPTSLDPNLNFSWSPSVLLEDAGLIRPLFLAAEAGVFEMILTVSEGDCSRDFVFTVSVEEPGTLVFDQEGLNACDGGCVEVRTTVEGEFTEFYWSPAGGVLDSGSPSTTICPDEDGFYVLTGLNEFNRCVVRDTLFVNVTDVPAPVVDAGPDLTLCVNEQERLGTEGQPQLSYQWTPSGFLTGSNTAMPLFSAREGGRFSYILQVYDEQTNCSNIDQVSVDVIDFSVSITSPLSVCSGAPFSLSLALQDNPFELDLNEFSFQWTPVDILNNAQVANPTAEIEESTLFEVQVIHLPSGCTRTAQQLVLVAGDPAPEIDFPGELIFCDRNQAYQIPIVAEQGFTYRWQPAFRLSDPNIANPIIGTPIPIGTVYRLTIEDTSRVDACRFGVKQIRLLEAPKPQLEDKDYIFCENSLEEITIGPDPEELIFDLHFQWQPNVGLDNSNVSNPVANADPERTYTLTVSRVSTDEIQYANCSADANYNILPRPLPVVNPGIDVGLCGPGSIQIGGPTNTELTYHWRPDSLLDNANLVRPLATVTETTTFYLEVTDSFGCSNSDSIQVIVSEVMINLVGFQDASCDEDGQGALEIEAIGGLAPYNYLWSTSNGSGLIPTAQNQDNLGVGDYQVTVTDAAGCTAEAMYTINDDGDCCDEIITTFIPPDLSVSCEDEVPLVFPEAADHCCEGGVQINVNIETIPLDCPQNFIERRIFTLTDICGNELEVIQEITKLDTLSPIFFSCGDLSVIAACGEDNEANILNWHQYNLQALAACAVDNCAPYVIIESDFDSNEFISACGNSGMTDVSYWAVDLCGNVSDTLRFTFTIVDTNPPSLADCPVLDETVSCTEGALSTLLNSWHAGNLSLLMDCAQEDCSDMIFLTHNFNVSNFVTADCGIGGTLTVRYVSVDLCSNQSAPLFATLTVVDETPPDVSACNLPSVEVDCSEADFPTDAINWHQNNLQLLENCAVDQCAGSVVVENDFDVDNFEVICGATGILTVNYTVSDPCGNVAEVITATWSIVNDGNLDLLTCDLDLDLDVACTGAQQENEILTWHADNLAAIASCGTSSCTDGLVVSSDFDLDNFQTTCGFAGSITVNYFIGDGCNPGELVLTAVFTSEDTNAPDISLCNSDLDLTVDCSINDGSLIEDWHLGNLTALADCATDGCSADIFIQSNFEDLDLNIACGENGTFTVTYLLSDDCGNQAIPISATLTVLNNSIPDLSLCDVNDITINCSDGDLQMQAEQWHLSNLDALLACANSGCNNIVAIQHDFEYNPGELDCTSENTIEVNYQALDVCGQLSEVLVLTLTITEPPIIDVSTCDLDLDLTAACNGDNLEAAQIWHANNIDAILDCLSGICAGAFSIVDNFEPPSVEDPCSGEDVLEVTYQIFNACDELIAEVSGILTILDNEAPTITWNESGFGDIVSGDTLMVECQANIEGWDLPEFSVGSVAVMDNCSDEIEVTVSETIEGGGNCIEDGYFYQIRCVWTATDECGNLDSLVLFIRIMDTQAPILHGVPADVTVDCTDIPAPPVGMACPDDPDACCGDKVWVSDACECAELFFEEENIFSGCEDTYQIIRTWTAIDNCENMATMSQTITVVRTLQPILVPVHPDLLGMESGEALNVSCLEDEPIPGWILALDENSVAIEQACPGEDLQVQFDLYIIEDNVDCSLTGYLQHWTAIWTLNSPCGEEAHYFLDIFIRDEVAPEISGLESVCQIDQAVIEATDACSVLSITFEDTNEPSLCVGGGQDIVRIWTAVDVCGNAATFNQRILNPEGSNQTEVISNNLLLNGLMDGDTLDLTCNPQSSSLSGFVDEDIRLQAGCGGSMEAILTEEIISGGACEDGFAYILGLTWTAEDPCAGTLTFEIVVRLTDLTGPVFEETFVSLSCGDAFRDPLVMDNCTEVTLEILSEEWLDGVNCEQVFEVQRVYLATDDCGNITERTILYEIERDGSVQFSGIGGGIICQDTSLPTVTATDVCTGESLEVTLSEETISDPCSTGERLIRVWSATDACGLTHERIQTILIGSDIRPEINLEHPVYGAIPADSQLELNCYSNEDASARAVFGFSESDIVTPGGCDLQVELKKTPLDPGNCEMHKIIEKERLVWVARDVCYNAASYEIEVEWIDDQAPEFVNPPLDITLGCVDLPPAIEPEVEMDCSFITLDFTETMAPMLDGDRVTRVWTATDECGNQNTHEQHITLLDGNNFTCSFGEFATPFCNSDNNSLTVYPQGGMAPYTYRWRVVGGTCEIEEGLNTETISFSIGFSMVNLEVTVTDATGCTSICNFSFNCNIDPKDRAEEGDSPTITFGGVHPNPAHNEVYFHYSTQKTQPVKVTISDAYGTLVSDQRHTLRYDERELRIELGELPAGMYYMVMRGEDDEPLAAKVIKY